MVAWSTTAAVAVPVDVPYIGDLRYDSGTPYNGNPTIVAAIYTTQAGGMPVWGPETWANHPVKHGTLALVFGGGQSPPLDSALLGQEPLWIQVSVNGLPLEPRQRMISVPYARLATDAQQLGGAPAAAYATLDSVTATLAGYVPLDQLTTVLLGEYALADQSCPPDTVATGVDASGGIVCGDAPLSAACTGCVAPLVAGQANIEALVEGVQTDMSSALGNQGSIQTAIASVQNAVGSLQSTANGLQTAVANVQGDTDALQLQATQLANAVAALDSDLTSIASTVNAIRGLNGGYSLTCDDFAARGWASKNECLRDGRWHRVLVFSGPFTALAVTAGAVTAFCANSPGIAAEYRIVFDDLHYPPMHAFPANECSDVFFYNHLGVLQFSMQNEIAGNINFPGTNNINTNVQYMVRY